MRETECVYSIKFISRSVSLSLSLPYCLSLLNTHTHSLALSFTLVTPPLHPHLPLPLCARALSFFLPLSLIFTQVLSSRLLRLECLSTHTRLLSSRLLSIYVYIIDSRLYIHRQETTRHETSVSRETL